MPEMSSNLKLTTFYIVAVAHFLIIQVNGTCITESKVDGCSVPLKSIFFPYAKTFESACDRHDICYSCGARFGWSRNNCDKGFLKDMLLLCDEHKNKKYCRERAKNYYTVTSFFGYFYYRWQAPSWCSLQQCVYIQGRPNFRRLRKKFQHS